MMEALRGAPKEKKPMLGKQLNAMKQKLEAQFALAKASGGAESGPDIDMTEPGLPAGVGRRHVLTRTIADIVDIFGRMGFRVAEGPEVEDEWHNFTALNIPEGHPAREGTDNFYMAEQGGIRRLLRTQTSTVQIRTMEKCAPPIRIIAPGAAYRRDEVDATHLAQFNQMEGLYVAEGVSIADLKGTLEFFFRELFGPDAQFRFRPHFFPFTEPSFEVDIKATALGSADRWLEIAGCGMVDPAVFHSINLHRNDSAYDPEKFTGFAFGFGLDRLAMIMSGTPDIRAFTENDLRFLSQF